MSGASNFLALARSSTREQFALAWSCPFLVYGRVEVEADFDFHLVPHPPSQAGALLDGARFEAVVVAGAPSGPVTADLAGRVDAGGAGGAALPLVKSRRDPDPGRLSIGRSRANDVILRSPQVSKAHAQLVLRPGGGLLLDVGSSNGTYRNGERLVPGQGAPVALGDRLRFGILETCFLDAGGLHDWLLSAAPR